MSYDLKMPRLFISLTSFGHSFQVKPATLNHQREHNTLALRVCVALCTILQSNNKYMHWWKRRRDAWWTIFALYKFIIFQSEMDFIEFIAEFLLFPQRFISFTSIYFVCVGVCHRHNECTNVLLSLHFTLFYTFDSLFYWNAYGTIKRETRVKKIVMNGAFRFLCDGC